MPNCRMLLRHCVIFAFCFALERAGNSMPARMAMIAITTRSSMSVKPFPPIRCLIRAFILVGLNRLYKTFVAEAMPRFVAQVGTRSLQRAVGGAFFQRLG